MKNYFLFVALLISIAGCNYSKSVKIDLISGMSTSGDLISCEDVFLSVDNKRTEETTILYGEKIYLNFKDIKGLKTVDGKVFPGMNVFVLGTEGDTVLTASDLYDGNSEGLSISPLQLSASIVAASPIHSGNEYFMHVRIWDKKDKGTFNANLKFRVETNKKIAVEASQVTYTELYLFSKGEEKVINDGKIRADDENYIIVEGLRGFTGNGDKVFTGLKLTIKDGDGAEVLNYDDLFAEYSESGLDVNDLNTRVSSSFVIPSAELKNPLHLTILIWDKKGSAKLSASTDLTYQK
jgi:hypothetical protein